MMMLDPTLIRRDMTPDEVLAAMLPVVREGFREPWKAAGCTPFKDDDGFDYDLWPEGLESHPDGTLLFAGQLWAIVFASHVLPALTEMVMPCEEYPKLATRAESLSAALTAFRDAWCDATEKMRKERK